MNKRLAEESIMVQDACNPRGVARGFVRAMDSLIESGVAPCDLTDNPIAILWADKIASLFGVSDVGSERCNEAYAKVLDITLGVSECTTCQEHGSGACYSLGADAEHVCSNL